MQKIMLVSLVMVIALMDVVATANYLNGVSASAVKSSGVYETYRAENATDGAVSNASRWIGKADVAGKIWLELKLETEVSVSAIQLFSGYDNADSVSGFYVEAKIQGGEWEKISSSVVEGNKKTDVMVVFETPVTTDGLRLVVTQTKDDLARVKEVVVLTKDRGVIEELLRLNLAAGQMNIDPSGFRFELVNSHNEIICPMHQAFGLRIGGQPVRFTVADPLLQGVFSVTTATGLKAKVSVHASGGMVSVTVVPEQDGMHKVELSMGGIPVAYGLGDAGGWSGNVNLVTEKNVRYSLKNNGSAQRWQSSFVICPENKLAGVVFEGNKRSVVLGPEEYTMSASTNNSVTFHYLLGDMPNIYGQYKDLLADNGFPWIKPKFGLFELGWESWAALGYQTRDETVLESITAFQDHGYPIRWAVTGSGFWEEGGTTTSFGKYDDVKFSNPSEFKKQLNDRHVKWMIGLRTNFILPGGPHVPVNAKRDFNLKVKTFNGNPLSTVGMEKGYFLKDLSGELIEKTSRYFPIVPCYMLDGRNSDAVDWYAGLYQKWNVDGAKEDTMINVGADVLDVFNAPISRLSDDGGLIMARCGSFSSSGTLLRINDTHVKDIVLRTPINYLHYAASGAPNVYSDTVGFRKMKKYSEKVVRHGWLMALNAGLAVAETPFKWSPEQQALFKKPIDFHYQFGPYLYDAAMKSYQTGYPYTLTTLGIAYPEDKNAAEPTHYQWMAGESLLCAPLLKNHESGKMDLYLPKGTWFDYDTGEKYLGPKLLKDFAMPVGKTPCFVGGKGILVTRSTDDAPLRAHIYPIDRPSKTFTFHFPDGKSTSTLSLLKSSTYSVLNATAGKTLPFEISPKSGAISFELQPGQSYELKFK